MDQLDIINFAINSLAADATNMLLSMIQPVAVSKQSVDETKRNIRYQ